MKLLELDQMHWQYQILTENHESYLHLQTKPFKKKRFPCLLTNGKNSKLGFDAQHYSEHSKITASVGNNEPKCKNTFTNSPFVIVDIPSSDPLTNSPASFKKSSNLLMIKHGMLGSG